MPKLDELKNISGKGHFYMPTPKLVMLGGLMALGILILGGVIGKSFVDYRKDVLTEDVRSRLEILSKGRADVVAAWLDGLKAVGGHITGADVVRLYSTEISLANALGEAGKDKLNKSLLAQKPYMQHTIKEYVRQNNLVQAMMVSDQGQIFLSSLDQPQLSETQLQGVVKVLERRQPIVFPAQLSSGQLLMDIYKPVYALEEESKSPRIVAVMMSTFKVGNQMMEMVATDQLSLDGERIFLMQESDHMIENIMTGDIPALQKLAENALDPFWLGNAGFDAHESVVDGSVVFGVSTDVASSPFVILHEYERDEALYPLVEYAQTVYATTLMIVAILVVSMTSYMVYVVGSRNRRRVTMQQQSMNALVRATEIRDPYLTGHSERVAKLALAIANKMDMNVAERSTLYYAAMMSGIGKIFVPREILNKPGKLLAKEKKVLHEHVNHALNVLQDSNFDLPIDEAISQMYERLDGSGYPNKLAGKEINELSRILAVCDVYCALVQPRSYRKEVPHVKAMTTFEKDADKFDSQVVDVLKHVVASE